MKICKSTGCKIRVVDTSYFCRRCVGIHKKEAVVAENERVKGQEWKDSQKVENKYVLCKEAVNSGDY